MNLDQFNLSLSLSQLEFAFFLSQLVVAEPRFRAIATNGLSSNFIPSPRSLSLSLSQLAVVQTFSLPRAIVEKLTLSLSIPMANLVVAFFLSLGCRFGKWV